MDVFNAGYKITDHISLNGENLVIGHHPKAPAPYAVWNTNEQMTDFIFGHYFTDKNDAIANMVERAMHGLEREDGTPVIVDALSQEAVEAVDNRLRESRELEDITEAVEDVIYSSDDFMSIETSVEDIVNNPEFLKLAKQAIAGIDHTKESDDLREAMEKIFNQNPKFLAMEPAKTSIDQMIQSAQDRQNQAAGSIGTQREQGR